MSNLNKEKVREALRALRLKNQEPKSVPKDDQPPKDQGGQPKAGPTPATTSGARVTKVNNKYQDINDINLSVSRSASNWDDKDFYQVRIFNVSQLSADECVLFGKSIFKAINEDSVTADVVFMMLYLAVSCKSTLDVEKNLLTPPPGMTQTIEYTKPTPSNEVDINSSGIEDQLDDIFDTPSASAPGISKRAMKRARAKKGAASRELEDTIRAARGQSEEHATSLSDKGFMAAAYTYIAAFLMRLQCRQPDSKMIEATKKAIERFSGFYDDGREVFDTLEISEESLRAIRDVIARKPEVTSTWVAWIAYNENKVSLVKQDFGLLEYLATQVFSYQGMHVVTQTLAIHQITAVPLGMLLREMDCQMTREAVREIYRIVKDYHRNADHPDRTTFYRYARVWNEGYFSRVQSKSCAQLLYLAAKIVKELGTNSNSDPTQIYAVKDLAASAKERLNKVADNIISFIWAQAADDEEAGDAWKI